MVIAIKIIQLLLSLSILVILHELGHFIAARSFKTRVEKFYLFFDPWFSLFKFKKGDTEYGIGWLPLGGYVKIAGMIDESLDTEQMKQPPQPWELRSKPAWQRLIVMLGGILVNLFLAVAIFAVMLAAWGERYLPADEAKYGVSVDSLGRTMGLQNGDIVLTVDRKPVDGFNDITEAILVDNAASVQVLRDGQQVDVLIPKGFVRKLIKANRADFLSPRFPFVIDEVMSSSAAQAAGMQKNDRIIGVNDSVRLFFSEIRADFRKYANQTVKLKVLRGADTVDIKVAVSGNATIGVKFKDLGAFFKMKEKRYNLLTAIPAGVVKAWDVLALNVKSFKLVFTQEKGYEALGGFITIGKIFPGTWDWASFWSLTAMLSIVLAIMNLLPIPGLDGGHVMFLLYEMIFRRKPSDKFMEYAQVAGMIFVLGLLLFVNAQDIIRLFR